MAIYVFREHSSTGARQLAEALGDGIRARRVERLRARVRAGDFVVSWGAPRVDGLAATILNNVTLSNKYDEAIKLKQAGVKTIEVARQRPTEPATEAPPDPLLDLWEDAQDMAEAFLDARPGRDEITIQAIKDFYAKIGETAVAIQRAAPAAPARPAENWLGREANHTGGTDLLNPPTVPAFWVKKEEFVKEFRVHSFLGKSIRAGQKVHRESFTGTPHPWIRSWDAGWRISYADGIVRQKHRDLAHLAVKALNLDFGAVDIGEKADGTLVVLEVNRAPGLEGGTVEAYARAVNRWAGRE